MSFNVPRFEAWAGAQHAEPDLGAQVRVAALTDREVVGPAFGGDGLVRP